jgi:hypothetical protein
MSEKFEMMVLIGADWNVDCNSLTLPLRSIMPIPANDYNQFEGINIDSIILISPNLPDHGCSLQDVSYYTWRHVNMEK